MSLAPLPTVRFNKCVFRVVVPIFVVWAVVHVDGRRVPLLSAGEGVLPRPAEPSAFAHMSGRLKHASEIADPLRPQESKGQEQKSKIGTCAPNARPKKWGSLGKRGVLKRALSKIAEAAKPALSNAASGVEAAAPVAQESESGAGVGNASGSGGEEAGDASPQFGNLNGAVKGLVRNLPRECWPTQPPMGQWNYSLKGPGKARIEVQLKEKKFYLARLPSGGKCLLPSYSWSVHGTPEDAWKAVQATLRDMENME